MCLTNVILLVKPNIHQIFTKFTVVQSLWLEVSSNAECDAAAGEVYRSQSPGKVSDIAACQKSCENDAGCKSITFFNSGWCSHFSTECTKTKSTNKAISMRLHVAQVTGPVAYPGVAVKFIMLSKGYIFCVRSCLNCSQPSSLSLSNAATMTKDNLIIFIVLPLLWLVRR